MDGNDSVGRLMHVFFQLHRQRINSGPVLGMNPGDVRVLRTIMRRDSGQGVMVSELGSMLKVSSPFITQVTNGLVQKGWVDRSPDAVDRRVVRLRITPRGEEAVARVSKEFLAKYAGLTRSLGPEKTEELIRLLQEVHQYFEPKREGKDE